MRVVALVLVALGCLGLGQYGVWTTTGNPAAAPGVPPAVCGIAVVCGLLLLVTTGTRRSG